jgi:hypothetical protein
MTRGKDRGAMERADGETWRSARQNRANLTFDSDLHHARRDGHLCKLDRAIRSNIAPGHRFPAPSAGVPRGRLHSAASERLALERAAKAGNNSRSIVDRVDDSCRFPSNFVTEVPNRAKREHASPIVVARLQEQ